VLLADGRILKRPTLCEVGDCGRRLAELRATACMPHQDKRDELAKRLLSAPPGWQCRGGL
jgi:hypothetical protein